jgi:hypothetical protein
MGRHTLQLTYRTTTNGSHYDGNIVAEVASRNQRNTSEALLQGYSHNVS